MFPPFWNPESAIKDAFNATFKLLMQLLTFSVNFDNLGIVQWLYGNVLTLGPFLAGLIVIVVVPAALIIRRYRLSGTMALMAALFSAAAGTLWFTIMSTLGGLGGDLTKVAASIGNDSVSQSGPYLSLPSIPFTNSVFDVVMFFMLFNGAFWFLMLFLSYQVMNVFIVAFGFLLVSMYGLGARTRKSFSVLVSIGIVTLIIGRPVAVAIMTFGNLVANAIPASLQWTGPITLASMGVAFLSQLVLPFMLYSSVHRVMGGMNAKVRNVVRSRIENKHKVDANVAGKVTSTTNRARSIQSPRYRDALKGEIGSVAMRTGMKKLAPVLAKTATVASNAHPVAKAAVMGVQVAGAAFKTYQKSKPPREKVNTLDDYRG